MQKVFEGDLTFKPVTGTEEVSWIPVVYGDFAFPGTDYVRISLLFDTGADCITLDKELYPLFGLRSWDDGGEPYSSNGTGGSVDCWRYYLTVSLLGKTINRCPVDLQDMGKINGDFHGLLGREVIFDHFGFGFWEKTHKLFYTLNP